MLVLIKIFFAQILHMIPHIVNIFLKIVINTVVINRKWSQSYHTKSDKKTSDYYGYTPFGCLLETFNFFYIKNTVLDTHSKYKKIC